MATEFKLKWDEAGQRMYETGVDRGVLYPKTAGINPYTKGVVWNGLTGVTESPSGAEATPLYADNIKYLNLMSVEEFKGTIEAFMYPVEFEACDGSASIATGVSIGQQPRTEFGLCYRTKLGCDDASKEGYKIHIVYNALAAPSEKAYATINDAPEAMTFSWEFTTTPVKVSGGKVTATVTIDSTLVDAEKLAALEAILYGSGDTEARLPLPDEIVKIITGAQ